MNIYENGYVYENTYNEHIMQINHECYLSSLLLIDYDILFDYFKGSNIIPVFRVFVLKNDETIDYEISHDVIDGSLSISFQSGLRRSLTLNLVNTNNKWAYGARKNLWVGTKFRLDAGVIIGDTLYWQQQGIFLLKDPSPTIDGSNQTISLTLSDKWSMWDGSVYGYTQLKTIIPTQVPMREAFDTIVHADNGLGDMWEVKPVRFNTQYWNTLTYYTIKQEAGEPISQPMLDMGKTISSDLYYDTQGFLNVENNVLEFMNNNFPIIWNFEEGDNDCSTPSLTYNRSKYYNQIKTKGAIVNGYQFSGTAQNKNKSSLYNIYDTPITPKVNNNTKLYSDNLCLEQSQYEMIEQSRGLRSVNMTCAYLPFLDVNKAVFLNFPSIGIDNGIYIIDSISCNIATDCKMTLSLTSNTEVVF